MAQKRFKVLWFLGTVLFISAVAIGLSAYVKASFTKSRVQRVLSNSLGMQVRIDGKLKTRLLPPSSLSVGNVKFFKDGNIVAGADDVIMNMPLRSFLGGEIKVTSLKLISPQFNIRRGKTGKLNFLKEAKDKKGSPFAGLKEISVRRAALSYADESSGHALQVREFDLDLRKDAAKDDEDFSNLSASGLFKAKTLFLAGLELSNFQCEIKAAKVILDLRPLKYGLFGGSGSGAVRVNMTNHKPEVYVTTEVKGFRPEQIPGIKEKFKGAMDAAAKFSLQRGQPELAGTITGDVAIKGKDLTLMGTDLDRSLSRYEKSQNFNLFDIGAFVFLGPIGSGLTTGYKMASALAGSKGGSTQVRRLASVWKISNGTAEAQDVALSTKENRVAFKGRLDLAHSKYENMTIAAVDERGCVKVSEKIEGPFNKPRVSRTGPVKSVVAPVVNVFRKTKRLITGKCEVFYSGSVPHPKK